MDTILTIKDSARAGKGNWFLELLSALFVFVLIVDPGNEIVGIKVPFFILLTFCYILAYPRIDPKLLLPAIIVYLILFVTSVIGHLASYDTNEDFMGFMYKSFLMLWLIPWTRYLRIPEKMVIPGIVVFFISCALFVIVLYIPGLGQKVSGIAYDSFGGTVMISQRNYLGYSLQTIYYTSIPVMLIPVALYYYRFLTETKQKARNLLISVILAVPSLIAGTRAMMLSVVAILLLLSIVKLKTTLIGRQVMVFALAVIVGGGVLVFSALMGDKQEDSLQVKTVLLDAFANHIDKYPETLLWGNGVGATYDSLTSPHGPVATQSEWTYLELIRWFGLPLGVVFMMVYIYPIIIIYNKRKILPYALPVILSFILYLLLGGTNPYLISSNGMLALLIVYCYAHNPYYESK